MATIAIIDYGMGNLHSVAKALEHVSPKTRILITQNANDLFSADRVIFPGQGAIKACIDALRQLELIETLKEIAATKPFLGLCLGPQALFDYSEENGGVNGLGILLGIVKRFPIDFHDPITQERLKTPHMGWNQVNQTTMHYLWQKIPQDSRFYFVHSFYLEPEILKTVAGLTVYGFSFASAVTKDNIFAVQFHPEKSARVGLQFLANFVRWQPN